MRKAGTDPYGEIDPPEGSDFDILENRGIYTVRGYGGAAAKARKAAGWVVIGSFFCAVAFVGWGAWVVSSKNQEMATYAQKSYNPSFKTRYEDLGKDVIHSYFAHKSPPINLMGNVKWSDTRDVSTVEENDSAVLSGEPVSVTDLTFIGGEQYDFTPKADLKDKNTFRNPTTEVLRYQGRIGRNLYSFTVNIIIPDKDSFISRPFLIDVPTVTPQNTLVASSENDTIASPATLPNSKQVKLSPEAVQLISRWASAYAQNDAESLKQVTGDQDQAWTYKGLGGFRSTGSPTVEWAYEINGTDDGGGIKKDEEVYTFVKIQAKFVPGLSRKGANGTVNDAIEQTYYLMMLNPTKANPMIVDWGGSWQTLDKYKSSIQVGEGKKEIGTNSTPESTTPSTAPNTRSNGSKIDDLPENTPDPNKEQGVQEGKISTAPQPVDQQKGAN